MLRLTFLLLLLATTLLGTQAHITSQINRWGNISVATIDSNLYWVTKNDSYVNIYSDYNSYQECNLELNDSHVGRIQVAGIDRKILLLYRQNSTGIRILQLDPFLCFYTPLPNLQTPVVSMDPQLVIVNNSLDVFLRGASDCLPCRLDVNGNRLEVPGQLDQGNNILVKSFILKELVPQNQYYRYAFAANFKNRSSVVRLLDEYFNTLDEKYFKYHLIEGLAVSLGQNSSQNQIWVGIIYAGLGSPHERILAMYSGAMELLFETRLVHLPGYKLVDTMLSINSTGHSVVSSIQSEPAPMEKWRHWRYAVYTPKGQLVDTDHIYSRFQKYDWQLLRKCNEDRCVNTFCSVLNSYEHIYEPHFTRSSVSCY